MLQGKGGTEGVLIILKVWPKLLIRLIKTSMFLERLVRPVSSKILFKFSFLEMQKYTLLQNLANRDVYVDENIPDLVSVPYY